ncbi:MAG TPA: DUF6569 family protein [Thermoplasmata archaeon]|nr:DUF6569 family protein [Thermoplasmata archaeon]
MPSTGESPLARFARGIVEGDGRSIGTPSLSDDGSAVVLSILMGRGGARGYVLANEVADEVSFIDPGRIDRVRIRNESRRRIFLPPGTLLAGEGTASRGITRGVLVDPRSMVDVEVRCVHASAPVRAHAPLELGGSVAPLRVRQALMSRDQGLVWEAVREFIATRAPSVRNTDDLMAALGMASSAASLPSATPSPSSIQGDPCGMIVLGAAGVEAMEVFDGPEPWARASPDLADGLRGESSAATFLTHQVIAGKAIELAKAWLLRLAELAQGPGTRQTWVAADSSAEWTVLGGEVIHLLAFRGSPWSQLPAAPGGTLGGAEAPDGLSQLPPGITAPAPGEGDVAVAVVAASDAEDDSAAPAPPVRIRRRKVLTSGWDASTFGSLERFASKEFGGDRSAAMRFLVRQGLLGRGYFGPRAPPSYHAPAASQEALGDPGQLEPDHATVEARISDYGRIAQTEAYAEWLRDRARQELARMASALEDPVLREAAQAALDRLPSSPPEPEFLETPPAEAIPPPPPVDVRPLLRRAFAASAAGQFSDALHLFDEVLDAEPDHRTALLGRAVALRRSGKSQEALEALDLVLRLEPTNAAALLNRGRVLQERGEFQAALETYDRLAAVAPNDWDVWVARGDVLARMDREPEALNAYSEAQRRNPDDESLKAKIRGIERARVPPPTSASRVALPRDVQEGQSYLIRGGPPDLGYRVFRALSIRSVPCLLVTPRDADRVRGEQGLGGVRILELTTEPGGDRVPPSSLVGLTNAIEHFLTVNRGRAAILLEGLSLLVETNGFRDTALFLARVNESILPSQGIFLVSVARGELAEKEAAILERDLRVLS